MLIKVIDQILQQVYSILSSASRKSLSGLFSDILPHVHGLYPTTLVTAGLAWTLDRTVLGIDLLQARIELLATVTKSSILDSGETETLESEREQD